MSEMAISSPYSTSSALLSPTALPSWLNKDDAVRLGAYSLYEDIYWTKPDTFKLQMRGTDDLPPIYLPSARIIINTINRYVGRDWSWEIDPTFGSDSEKQAAQIVLDDLFVREEMETQFEGNKLYGLIRGDACWMLLADADKAPGSRVSIRAIDPGSYFPIEDPNDINKIIGQDLIEQLVMGDDLYIKRQRWLKPGHEDNPSAEFISYQMDSYEIEDWEDETKAKTYTPGGSVPVTVVQGITQLPIYHIRNFVEPENPWGSSEMRGIERLFSAINQTMTDTDIAIALQGLGLYWTDSGAPVDDDDNDTPWNLGPGEVVEVGQGKKFGRVQGITSITPALEHMEKLEDQISRVTGASDVAQGRVDVEMAESGIALKLRMGPILDEALRKNKLIRSKLNQMTHNLREWLRVYEGYNMDNIKIINTFGPMLPENEMEFFKQLMDGLNAPIPLWDTGYVRDQLRKRGWDIPLNMLELVFQEQAAQAEFADPYAVRAGEETADEEEGADDGDV